MKNKKLTLLVCHHKADIYYSDDIYMPIHVGKALAKDDLGIQGDDTGDNISTRNASFCELTGLYWAWKNLADVNYIGLCHYRRYFNFQERVPILSISRIISTKKMSTLNFDTPSLSKIFDKHKVIMVNPIHFPHSIHMNYCTYHISEDLTTLTTVINELYPKYSYDWKKLCHYSNKCSPYNMFIMRKDDFDKYCKWLFDILFEVAKRVDISNYDNIQKRIFGFMGERLLMLYVQHNNMNPKYYPIYFIDNTRIERYKRVNIFNFLSFLPKTIKGLLMRK